MADGNVTLGSPSSLHSGLGKSIEALLARGRVLHWRVPNAEELRSNATGRTVASAAAVHRGGKADNLPGIHRRCHAVQKRKEFQARVVAEPCIPLAKTSARNRSTDAAFIR